MHSLALGDFDLIGGQGVTWQVETIADGMSFGQADAIQVVQRTLLQDGDAVTIDRYGNREVTFQVKVTADDSAALAEAGAALDAEVGVRNTLTWIPPDEWGPITVFDVFTSVKSFEFNDWGEMKPSRIGRIFTLTLVCHPFPRSEDESVAVAVASGTTPPTPSTVTVDDCTSSTGWTRSTNPGSTSSAISAFGPTVTSGAVRAGYTWTAAPATVASARAELTRSGLTSDMTSTPLLKVEATAESPAAVTFAFEINGAPAVPLARSGDVFWFDCTDLTTLTSLSVAASSSILKSQVSTGWTIAVRVADISRTNVDPIIGTGRQQFRQIQVGGSARAVGSLVIEHETSSLGQVLVYTNAEDGSGYQPPCRQYRSAGGTANSDSSTASGARSPLDSGTPETYLIPIDKVPAGAYSFLARVRMTSGTATGLLTVTASTRLGSTDLGTRSEGRYAALTTSWSIAEAARLVLPPVAARSDAFVKITIAANVAAEIDDLWILNTDIGALTWVDCGASAPSSGGSSNRLWIDTATLDWPRPAIWLGTEADGSDRRHVIASTEERSRGTHTFPPGTVNVFTMTSNALNAAASLRFYKRWMDMAA